MSENENLNLDLGWDEPLNNDKELNEENDLDLDERSEEQKQIDLNIATWITYAWDKDRNISDEMETCYLDYAMSVIVQRALPDVRDWLKPVHRRILFAMDEEGLRPGSKYRKSATVVWAVLWKYHPHGDSSVYEAMVRMAQDFSMRYPLVDGQWNFGSMDWDNAAAMRYTEAKMTKMSEMMLADIDKDTITWRDNYDATRKEPSVLPTRLPNLLMNWVMGIAVGMATNIPPHNLWELLEAIKFLLTTENPNEVTVEDLMEFIKGPDFPTGWIIYDKEAILNAFSTGRWSVIMRWVATIDENTKSGRKNIIISEVPYQLNKSNLITKIADLVKEKIIVWIHDIRDESNKDWVRVVIELKKDAFPKKILNQLYKLTPLQTSFSYNMIALGDRWLQPKLYNIKEILEEFIEHRKEVVTNRTKYELKVAEARAHILEWLKIALDNIDEIIKVIRAAYDDAEIQLMKAFALSEIQAGAIVEMKLRRLQGLEKEKIEEELAEKLSLIADLKDILAKPQRVVDIIMTEIDEIATKFASPRRTQVNNGKIWEFNPKDTIPNEEVVIVLSKNAYIKRVLASSFRTQRRWWTGVTTATKEDDEIKLVLSTKNHNDLLFFTSAWRVFSLPAFEIPESQRTAKWQAIVNLLSLQKDEEISAILDITEEKNKYLVFVTKNGTIKKLDMDEVKKIRSNWLIVLKVKDGDSLSWVKTTSGSDNVFIVTKEWKAIQFSEEDVRPMGRTASGVRWIRLAWKDEVVETAIVAWDVAYVFTITENAMWKITEIEEYRSQWRWGSWAKSMAITPKTWKLMWVITLKKEDLEDSSILLISREWQTIRLPLNTIRVTSRVTQWVILSKLRDKDDCIVSASLMKTGENPDEEAKEETNNLTIE